MGRDEFVPVACDDWYQRRRRDAEGEFFISVANQGPRKGEGGSTRQGIYILTASGKLLAYKNVGQNPPAMLDLLREGLAKWKQLPEWERAAGAVKVPPHGKVDTNYDRQPPTGGVILKVYARALDRAKQTSITTVSFTDAECTVGRGDEASRDHLWLTEAEWRSLTPEHAQVGARFPFPAKIAERILRFHLVDSTRGEPPFWRRSDIRTNEINLVVQRVTPEEIHLRLEGSVRLATDADQRGYEPMLTGSIKYDRKQQRLTQFDVVAIGDHWGSGAHTRRATRPGRTPLGVAFELTSGASPQDRIAPQGARNVQDYFGR